MQVIARLITSVHTWLNDHKHKQLYQLMSIAAASPPPLPSKKQFSPKTNNLYQTWDSWSNLFLLLTVLF